VENDPVIRGILDLAVRRGRSRPQTKAYDGGRLLLFPRELIAAEGAP
jgi:hypothetical protein